MITAGNLVTVCLEVREAGRVAFLTVNNPKKRNALARETDEPQRLMAAFLERRKKR
jgi:enoyl-CoA hydratase/carnithine racemase